jgi:hypothetical protein
MQKVFATSSLWLASEVAELLRQNRVDATLRNEHAAGTPGVLPLNPLMAIDVEVWVVEDRDAPAAARLIAEFQSARQAAGASRQCPRCGESNPGNFDVCWSCSGALDSDRPS